MPAGGADARPGPRHPPQPQRPARRARLRGQARRLPGAAVHPRRAGRHGTGAVPARSPSSGSSPIWSLRRASCRTAWFSTGRQWSGARAGSPSRRCSDALPRGARSVAQLAEALPAHFVAFDVLQIDGRELLTAPYEHHRATLENLFTEHKLAPPWTLCPMTSDPVLAQEWLTSWTDVPGVEGVLWPGFTTDRLTG
ncbi:ATP-dependent DNA ligase [Streptomyces sp. URMC 123]|uniref:ATP-dependent DNA ligase n=1 Tax=Streptomyces sp. URMC 123 TaxID=3423403 RepID=UPI003F1D94D8